MSRIIIYHSGDRFGIVVHYQFIMPAALLKESCMSVNMERPIKLFYHYYMLLVILIIIKRGLCVCVCARARVILLIIRRGKERERTRGGREN
jgi:hypothetical protein